MIYEFKVTLKNVGIPVSRTVQIDGQATFLEFHRLLQVTFNWLDYHLYNFDVRIKNGHKIEDVEIAPEEIYQGELVSFYDPEVYDVNEEKLSDWFKVTKDLMMYVYDLGDYWEHEIIFQKKVSAENGVTYPRCTDAKHFAPEEDSRGEVIAGNVNLEHTDSLELIKDINVDIAYCLKEGLLINRSYDQLKDDVWHKLFTKSKAYDQIKPWEAMDDDDIFMIIDPKTGQDLFCSVLGSGDEVYGLAVYIGREGYLALTDTMEGQQSSFQIMQRQHSLLLSFEDRNDLEKEEYAHIKTYDIPFRGRKAWPTFRSYKPGHYPWFINDEEARLLLISLEQTINIHEEVKNGVQLPHILDDVIMAKVPKVNNDQTSFCNEMINLDKHLGHGPQVQLEISEFDIKRIKKNQQIVPMTIEFSCSYIDMPIQEQPDDRPIFPLLILAAGQDDELIYYQNLLKSKANSKNLQHEFINMLQAIEGIPGKVMMNSHTAFFMKP